MSSPAAIALAIHIYSFCHANKAHLNWNWERERERDMQACSSFTPSSTWTSAGAAPRQPELRRSSQQITGKPQYQPAESISIQRPQKHPAHADSAVLSPNGLVTWAKKKKKKKKTKDDKCMCIYVSIHAYLHLAHIYVCICVCVLFKYL